MMLRVTSLRAAHLVLWSSPILLLVLVFTVSSPPKLVARSRGTTQREVTTAPRATSTSTVATSTTVRPTSTTEPTTTVSTTSRAITAVKPDSPSVISTGATAPPVASPLIVGAASGALVGDLSTPGASSDVPLQGPGAWIIQSSAPILEQLLCSGSTRSVSTTINIDALTTCQLHLTSGSPGPVHWQIVPSP